MAETNMVELVIKMPEDVFKRTVFYREFRDLNDSITTIKALEKAVLLPKGHGRLKDADKIANEVNALKDNWNRFGNEYESGRYESYDYAVDTIDNADTIIEADENSKDIKTISSLAENEKENKEDIEL